MPFERVQVQPLDLGQLWEYIGGVGLDTGPQYYFRVHGAGFPHVICIRFEVLYAYREVTTPSAAPTDPDAGAGRPAQTTWPPLRPN